MCLLITTSQMQQRIPDQVLKKCPKHGIRHVTTRNSLAACQSVARRVLRLLALVRARRNDQKGALSPL
jgi:hypothetical protein